MSTNLTENLIGLNNQIKDLTLKYKRDDAVQLIAVSKTRSSQEIRAAAEVGQKDFGENYLQEAIEKMSDLDDLPLIWHYIGPIQKNKTKQIAENFDWVHSLDRAVIASRLNDQRPEDRPPLNVCIQMNIDKEESKSGIDENDLFDLAQHISSLPKLSLRGLMAIPSAKTNFDEQYNSFAKISALNSELQESGYATDTLSMGMSNDYEAAIACGATMIRIGTAIFGERNYK